MDKDEMTEIGLSQWEFAVIVFLAGVASGLAIAAAGIV